jgi:hypothetical protein
MSVFSNLPLVIIDIILSYDNVIRFRNGKYINQIADNDYRKEMLTKIPIKYDFIWWPGNNIITTVVLHINHTKYYSIDYQNYVLTIATLQHSGIDYQKKVPSDSDESTLLLTVDDLLIM